MMIPDSTMLRLIVWIARRLGLRFDLDGESIIPSLDEHEVSEQLRYGRD